MPVESVRYYGFPKPSGIVADISYRFAPMIWLNAVYHESRLLTHRADPER
jgi:hypothetical protein